jgi:hypothetical protein
MGKTPWPLAALRSPLAASRSLARGREREAASGERQPILYRASFCAQRHFFPIPNIPSHMYLRPRSDNSAQRVFMFTLTEVKVQAVEESSWLFALGSSGKTSAITKSEVQRAKSANCRRLPMLMQILEPVRAYLSRKRLERRRSEAACRLLEAGPSYVPPEDDAADWQLLGGQAKNSDDTDLDALRTKARILADTNPYARNILTMLRSYVVGTGMKHEVSAEFQMLSPELQTTQHSGLNPQYLNHVRALWNEFLAANDWHTGNRKDWEFCLRTWRDGECFLRLFRQDNWPPRIHFIDPEHVAPDPATGLPTHGIETAPGNVEVPVAYHVFASLREAKVAQRHAERGDHVPADRILHTKIGVDANVKRGVTLFRPVLDALRRFQGWLDVELIHRKLASSIVLVRKHN